MNKNPATTVKAMNTTETLISKLEPLKDIAIEEGTDALWRVAAEQYKETIRVPFLAALYRNLGLKNGTVDKVIRAKTAKFFETDVGDAVFTYMLSFSTQFLKYKQSYAQRLSKELRVAAQSKLFSKVLTAFFGPMRTALDEAIRGNGLADSTQL